MKIGVVHGPASSVVAGSFEAAASLLASALPGLPRHRFRFVVEHGLF